MAKRNKSSKKTYVLDTNILMSSPHALFAFDEHDIVLTDVTLDELDDNKTREGETGFNARETIRLLEDLRRNGDLVKGVKLPLTGGTIRVEFNHVGVSLPASWDADKPDHRILKVCKGLQMDGKDPILVSNDIAVRIKADILGVKSEEYRSDQVVNKDEQYTGRRVVYADTKAIEDLYSKGEIHFERVGDELGRDIEAPSVNEFFVITDVINKKHTGLARFDGKMLVRLKYENEQPYGIIPRNLGQRFAIEALLAPVEEAPLVILKGPAGSAKTFLSLAAGLERVVNTKKRDIDKFDSILVTRPNMKMDDDIGFLKGSEEDKIGPLMRPIFDNIQNLTKIKGQEDGFTKDGKYYPYNYADELLDTEKLQLQALAYMRGRSITDTWVIVDESQNLSTLQAFSIISRIGAGSKIILTGDVDQIDNPRLDSRTNGLSFASERMKGSPLCWQVTFTSEECVRSALALEAIKRLSPKGYAR